MPVNPEIAKGTTQQATDTAYNDLLNSALDDVATSYNQAATKVGDTFDSTYMDYQNIGDNYNAKKDLADRAYQFIKHFLDSHRIHITYDFEKVLNSKKTFDQNLKDFITKYNEYKRLQNGNLSAELTNYMKAYATILDNSKNLSKIQGYSNVSNALGVLRSFLYDCFTDYKMTTKQNASRENLKQSTLTQEELNAQRMAQAKENPSATDAPDFYAKQFENATHKADPKQQLDENIAKEKEVMDSLGNFNYTETSYKMLEDTLDKYNVGMSAYEYLEKYCNAMGINTDIDINTLADKNKKYNNPNASKNATDNFDDEKKAATQLAKILFPFGADKKDITPETAPLIYKYAQVYVATANSEREKKYPSLANARNTLYHFLDVWATGNYEARKSGKTQEYLASSKDKNLLQRLFAGEKGSLSDVVRGMLDTTDVLGNWGEYKSFAEPKYTPKLIAEAYMQGGKATDQQDYQKVVDFLLAKYQKELGIDQCIQSGTYTLEELDKVIQYLTFIATCIMNVGNGVAPIKLAEVKESLQSFKDYRETVAKNQKDEEQQKAATARKTTSDITKEYYIEEGAKK